MPLTAAPWWYFSRGTVESDRDDPGVYEMGNASDSVVYIGSSDALRRRLKEHLSESDLHPQEHRQIPYRIHQGLPSSRAATLRRARQESRRAAPVQRTASLSAGFSLR